MLSDKLMIVHLLLPFTTKILYLFIIRSICILIWASDGRSPATMSSRCSLPALSPTGDFNQQKPQEMVVIILMENFMFDIQFIKKLIWNVPKNVTGSENIFFSLLRFFLLGEKLSHF